MAEPLVDIKFDEAKLKKIQRMLAEVPGAMKKIMPWAINRTTIGSKAEIATRLRAEINLKQKRVRQGLRIEKASGDRWEGMVDIFTKRVPLIHFGAQRLKGKGVSYKIAKSGGRKKIVTPPMSAFIQTMPSGHIGVFRRASEARGSMYQLKGPSLGEAFEGAAGLAAAVQAKSGAALEKNVDQRIAYILGKWRGAG